MNFARPLCRRPVRYLRDCSPNLRVVTHFPCAGQGELLGLLANQLSLRCSFTLCAISLFDTLFKLVSCYAAPNIPCAAGLD